MTSRACVHYADEDKSVSKLSLSELRLEYVLVFFNVSALFTLMPLLTPQKRKAWFGALPVVPPSVARHGHGVPAATLLRTWPRKRSLCSTKTVLSNSFFRRIHTVLLVYQTAFNRLLAGRSLQVSCNVWRTWLSGWLLVFFSRNTLNGNFKNNLKFYFSSFIFCN